MERKTIRPAAAPATNAVRRPAARIVPGPSGRSVLLGAALIAAALGPRLPLIR